MNPGVPRIALVTAAVLCLLGGLYLMQTRPYYFSDIKYLGALLLLEVVLVAAWNYAAVIFPLLILSFLWAGVDVPLSGVGKTVRWVLLFAAAGLGFVAWMRERRHAYGAFHLVAFVCALTAFLSALVSADPRTSLLKVLSLFLLFLYGATGARLAILGREVKFAKGLVLACEIVVVLSAVAYLGMGHELFGNPNSLGAVMGVVMVPVLLWGVLIAETPNQKYRRMAVLALACGLLYDSLARASILAAAVAVVVMSAMLRRHRLLLKGAFVGVLFVAVAAVANPTHFESFIQSLTSNVLYKGKPQGGVFGSRQSPWEETVAAIKGHPWFGTGFGTSYMGQFVPKDSVDLSLAPGALRTKAGTNREHGNSYLALVEYVGLLGIVPFALLLVLIVRMIVKVCLWMRRTSNPYHCAIPFAMVTLAGLVHAFFEDWLVAVGYYLCVFFWSCAFWLHDLMPSRATTTAAERLRSYPQAVDYYGAAVPNR